MFLLDVPRQPHCGEVSPSQLSDDMVLPVEKVSYLHMVISTWVKDTQQQAKNTDPTEKILREDI